MKPEDELIASGYIKKDDEWRCAKCRHPAFLIDYCVSVSKCHPGLYTDERLHILNLIRKVENAPKLVPYTLTS